jgi:hypothetical protein
MLLFMAFAMMLALPAVAFADNVQTNDVDTNGDASKTPGQSGSAFARVVANAANEDVNGCNVSTTAPATVSFRATQNGSPSDKITFNSPGSVQVTACGNDGSKTLGYKVASSAQAGDVLTITTTTTGGVSGSKYNEDSFTVTVTAPAAPSDTTAPVITPTVQGTLGENSWYTSNVNVSWLVEDGESDISSTSGCGPTTISTDTAGTTLTCTATSAGGTSSDSVTIKRDATAPTSVSGTLARAADHNGWYTAPVGYQFSGNDPTSGIASCSSGTYSGPDGTDLTVSGSCADNAGNSANGSSPAFKYDATKPTDITFFGAPNAGGSYDYGTAPAAPTCTAKDATSGMPDNGGCVVTDSNLGGFSATGSHTLTATATDNAGNVETATRTYTVAPYRLSGFYQPVDMGGVVNTVKGGSTVPLKFELFQSISGTELTDTSGITLTATKSTCALGATEDAIEVTATGGTSLRYDSTGGQFIYNWKTPTGTGCYTVTMIAADGSKITAYFKSLK